MATKRSLVRDETHEVSNLPAAFDIALPSVFDGPAPTVKDSGGGSTYVSFFSVKSPKAADLMAAIPGLREPDVVLVQPAPKTPIKLNPFKFTLLTGLQYWAENDSSGNLTRVWLDSPPKRSDAFRLERFETVVLAFHGDSVVPAKATFSGTKAKAGKAAVQALALAAKPEWGQQSEAHRRSLEAPKPFLRFTTTVTCKPKVSRSKEMAGSTYYLAEATVAPAVPSDWRVLGDFFKSPDNKVAVDAVVEAYKRRVAEIAGLVREGD